MKIFRISVMIFFSIINYSPILAQQTPSVQIIAPDAICRGDSVLLKASLDATGEISYIWILDKLDNKVTGNNVRVLPFVEDEQNEYEVTCTAYIGEGNNVTTSKATKKIKINNPPLTPEGIIVSQFANNLLLEVKSPSESLLYEWVNPNKEKKIGASVKYSDAELSDFGEYKLVAKDRITNCSITVQYQVDQKDKEDKTGIVFGTVDDKGIPDKLYRETKKDFPVYECNILGEALEGNYRIAYPGYQFTLIGEIDDNYIIRFWSKKLNKEKSATDDTGKKYESTNEYSTDLKNDIALKYKISNESTTENLISGKVSVKDEPLTGASLSIYNGKNFLDGTNSDVSGKFTLKIKKDIPSPIIKVAISGYSEVDFDLSKSIKQQIISEGVSVTPVDNNPSKEKLQFGDVDPMLFNAAYVKLSNTKDKLGEYRYFKAKKSDVDYKSIPFLPLQGVRFTAGAVLIPVKLRRSFVKKGDGSDNVFEFSKDIAIGSFIGLQKRISKYQPNFINFGVAIGISSARLTSENSNKDLVASVQDLAALTLAGGVVMEFDRVQVGLFFGTDRINNNSGTKGYDWGYQGKLWWSFGFGYSILSRPAEKTNTQEN